MSVAVPEAPATLRARTAARFRGVVRRSTPPTSLPSHRHLLGTLDVERWSARGTAPSAIVVPTARAARQPRSGLSFAARLAAAAGCPLVVLVSKEAAEPAALRRLREQVTPSDRPPADTLVLRVSDAASPLTTFPVDDLRVSVEFRRGGNVPGSVVPVNDVGRKRNLAVALARAMGWRSLLLLDDDVFVSENGEGEVRRSHPDSLTVPRLRAAVGAVNARACRAVGWTLRDFDDNSVLFRMRHELGLVPEQDQFIGGGALVVPVNERTPFFPGIYNEDWLFLLASLRADGYEVPWLDAGNVHQDPYPAYPANRAAAEEFGDLLGEGLMSLIDPVRPSLVQGTRDHWQRAFAERFALAGTLRASAERSDHEERDAMLGALDAVDAVHQVIRKETARWAARMTNFHRAWERDLDAWRARLLRSRVERPKNFLAGREFATGGVEVVHGRDLDTFIRLHGG